MSISLFHRFAAFSMTLLIGLLTAADQSPKQPLKFKETGPYILRSVDVQTPSEMEPITTPLSDTIPQMKVCNDPEIKPIWNAIRRKKEVRDALDAANSPADCREAFEILYLDLNRDGRKEILARAIGIPFCGAVGNCDSFVLQRTKKGLRLLLHADDYVDATEMGKQVVSKRSNGYLDIVTLGHFSASETSYTTYKYNGKKYVEASCRYEVPKYDKNGNLDWEMISCKEFYRRLDRELDQLVSRR